MPADHPTIQSAIVAAQSGDTILVAAGTYNEQLDYLGKALSVVATEGPSATVLDASGLIGWFDSPFLAAVRFVNGEGPGSVLQGFTITGHDSFSTSGSDATIVSEGNPLVIGCEIVGNRGKDSGGFSGSGTLSGCLFEGNSSFQGGGAIRGTAQVFDCIVRNNSAPGIPGGGIYAEEGLTATRCLIEGNRVDLDGHSGGGVFGPAVLTDCEILGNIADAFGGQNEGGSAGVTSALRVEGCTVSDNLFVGGDGYAIGSGVEIVDTIVWGNQTTAGAVNPGSTATYSCIEGGFTGTGNIALDPLFVDAAGGDYRLDASSPCIDAGDPASPLDPDGTTADMGANFVPQFTATFSFRWGSTFSLEYVPQAPPILGSTMQVDVTATPSTTATAILVQTLPSSPIALPFGELLIDLTSPQIFADLTVPVAGTSTHSIPIPADASLNGLEVYSQAVLLGGPTALTNAVDFLLGL